MVRSASTEFQLNVTTPGASGFNRRMGSESSVASLSEVDGYFGSKATERRPSSVVMKRSNSIASSTGVSLRINDGPERRGSLATEIEVDEATAENDREGEEEDGDGTITAFPTKAQANAWMGEGAGEVSFDVDGAMGVGEGKEQERIVVQKSGLVYHESCWKRLHPSSDSGDL